MRQGQEWETWFSRVSRDDYKVVLMFLQYDSCKCELLNFKPKLHEHQKKSPPPPQKKEEKKEEKSMVYNMWYIYRYKERKQLMLATAEAEKRMRNAGIFIKSEIFTKNWNSLGPKIWGKVYIGWEMLASSWKAWKC